MPPSGRRAIDGEHPHRRGAAPQRLLAEIVDRVPFGTGQPLERSAETMNRRSRGRVSCSIRDAAFIGSP